VAVGRWAARGKEQLVLLRAYRGGLVLHQLYYSNEVRSFDEVDDTAKFTFSDKERELAERLVDQLSSDRFDAEQYRDDYADRVRALIERKVAGEEITAGAEAPRAQIIDLFEALKQSIAEGKRVSSGASHEPAPVTPRPPRKAEPGVRPARKKRAS
jgi:DNA end-binding protein Ku